MIPVVRPHNTQDFLDAMERCGVPTHLRDGLALYIVHGVQPGDFLMAILENDLMEAMGRADNVSRASLFSICDFIYNYAPALCHGNARAVKSWLRESQEETA